MITAYLSDFDRLTPAQRATVQHWIIDDPDRPQKSSDDLQVEHEWDRENEEIGR